MKKLFVLAAGALLALALTASAADGDCINARDPVRCEARQAALISCAGMPKLEKQACLDARLPPVDCSKSDNPQRCEVAENAKLLCAGKSGKAAEKCLRAGEPSGEKKARKRPTKSKAEKRSRSQRNDISSAHAGTDSMTGDAILAFEARGRG